MNTRPSTIQCPACHEHKPIGLMREHVGKGEYVTLSACRDCQSNSQVRFRGRRLKA